MFAVAAFTLGTVGLFAALTCMGFAVRRMDDIWHSRRAWAPRFMLIGLGLLFGSIALLCSSPLTGELLR